MNNISSAEAQAQVGSTADGVAIVDALAVITNDMRAGRVDLSSVTAWSEGWFDVVHADGSRSLMNGERVAARFEGKSAVEMLARDEA